MSASGPGKIDLHGLDYPSLLELTLRLGGGARMAGRIFNALYDEDGPGCVMEIEGVRKGFLEKLDGVARVSRLMLRQELPSDEAESTVKYVLAGEDGKEFETVTIPARDRLTICISSQVGCRMGCTFCQTGTMGLIRNLTAAEIVHQVLFARSRLPAGRRITNIVYMGMGEPMDNFDAVWRSYSILQEHRGLSIPRNRITISSVGLVPGLEQLAATGVPVNLALSLNASENSVRDEIMPVNRRWPMERLLEVADSFPRRPGRNVCVEYVLLEGVNDRDEDVNRLATLLEGRRIKVNVIAYNPVPGLPHRRPSPERVEQFAALLAGRGVWTMIRHSRGVDVLGACGQLGCGRRASDLGLRVTGKAGKGTIFESKEQGCVKGKSGMPATPSRTSEADGQ